MAEEATETESRLSRLRRKTSEKTKSAAKSVRKAVKIAWGFARRGVTRAAKATGRVTLQTARLAIEVVARSIAWVLTVVFTAVSYALNAIAAIVAMISLGIATIIFAVASALIYGTTYVAGLNSDYVIATTKWVAKGRYKNDGLKEFIAAHRVVSIDRLRHFTQIIEDYFKKRHDEAHEGDIIENDGFLADPKTGTPYPFSYEDEECKTVDPKTGAHLDDGQRSRAPITSLRLARKVQQVVENDLTSTGDEFPGVYRELALQNHNDRDLPVEAFEPMYADPGTIFDPRHEVFEVYRTAGLAPEEMEFSKWVDDAVLTEFFDHFINDQRRSRQDRAYWLGRRELIELYHKEPELTGKASHGRAWSRIWARHRHNQAEIPMAYLRVGVLDMIQDIHTAQEELKTKV